MEQPVLHEQHRGKTADISRKHGHTLVSTLRRIYGDSFARGFDGRNKLRDVLSDMDEESLTRLVNDHEIGRLHVKLAGPRVGNG